MVRRNAAGDLETIPYSVFFEEAFGAAAEELGKAASLAEDPGSNGTSSSGLELCSPMSTGRATWPGWT